jgi:hypothetical protein
MRARGSLAAARRWYANRTARAFTYADRFAVLRGRNRPAPPAFELSPGELRAFRRARRTRRARRAVMLLLDALGLALIIVAAWVANRALGFLVAGVIALCVAVIASPPGGTGQADVEEVEGE